MHTKTVGNDIVGAQLLWGCRKLDMYQKSVTPQRYPIAKIFSASNYTWAKKSCARSDSILEGHFQSYSLSLKCRGIQFNLEEYNLNQTFTEIHFTRIGWKDLPWSFYHDLKRIIYSFTSLFSVFSIIIQAPEGQGPHLSCSLLCSWCPERWAS